MLCRHYTSVLYGFSVLRRNLGYSEAAPVVVTAFSLMVIYLATRGIRV